MCAVWILFANPATAQTAQGAALPAEDAAVGRARALFNEGTEKARRGDWSQALLAFERSEALRPHAVTTYNIGFCERALGRTTRARRTLHEALAENAARGGAELSDDLAAATKTYLAEFEQRLARAKVTIARQGASLSVDGRPLERATNEGPRPVLWAGTRDPGPGEAVPASFELQLDPGPHVLVVAMPGYADEVTTRTFEEGSNVELILALSPPPAPEPAHASRSPESGVRRPARLPLYLALGFGGAGLSTGIVAGAIALAQKAKLGSGCKNFACSGDDEQVLSRADTAADVSTTGFIVGGVGIAVAAVIWWLTPTPAPGASSVTTASPEGGVLTAWMTAGGGGVSGTF